ncbi:MAG: hypothetical protein K6B72_10805 [Lachnospiraceae bacterium]|nr:hypothetical protein [Lachnospiraceae bacterium]
MSPQDKKKKKRRRKPTGEEIVKSRNRLLAGRDLAFLRIIAVSVLCGLVLTAATVIYIFRFRNPAVTEQSVEFTEQKKLPDAQVAREYLHEGILDGINSAGRGVCEALNARPEEIEISGEEMKTFASIDSVRIADGGTISVSVTAPGLPASDDKYYYLFEEKIWQDELEDGQEPVSRAYKDASLTITADLNRGSADSRLFSRFSVAVRIDGQYRVVSHAKYVENPEALASVSYGGVAHTSKKGLLIDPNRASGSEWDDLGVQYCTYNFPMAHILGPTTNAAYPTINYTYHGKNYQFNGAHIHQYDYLFSILTRKKIDITAILLDDASPSAYPAFTHPSARSGSTAPYYMFNAATPDGVEALGAVATFLANRYSGSDHGRVQNWIVGNEVNARKEWNYMPAGTSLDTFTAAYAKAYRVFYNAIKSVNSAAGVYICLDQQWDRNKSNNPDYDARDLLDLFAADVRACGDIDWGLAFHPYSCPLTQAAFWKANKLVNKTAGTSFVTMDNIGVVTDYLHQEQFLMRNGQVRSVILSEQGYTSTAGQELQAAAFAYAYKIAAANPDIDIFIYSRETDHAVEIAQSLALGLTTTGGGHKRIYDVYKHIDKADGNDVAAFALGIIGISSWP